MKCNEENVQCHMHNFITFGRKDAGDFFSSYLPLKIFTFCKFLFLENGLS